LPSGKFTTAHRMQYANIQVHSSIGLKVTMDVDSQTLLEVDRGHARRMQAGRGPVSGETRVLQGTAAKCGSAVVLWTERAVRT
jgi:hypothetical protein